MGARVQCVPDTASGIAPEHSVAVYGTIAEVKAEGGWMYRIKSMHTGRNGPWMPEHRVVAISKPLYDNVSDATTEPIVLLLSSAFNFVYFF